jgi:periplasmic divalent cation tolerance protein
VSAGGVVEIVTTVAAEEDAARLARRLVEEGPVACATFFPVRSVYRWQGQVQDEAEYQIVCKTDASRAAEVEARIASLHPYDTPAILRMPVARANVEYAAWVAEAARRGPAGE